MITCILAKSDNDVIGKDNKLPWNLPEDLRKFKEFTLNKTIVMGRKTFESIGRPLPKRKNCVISRTVSKIDGCLVYNSINDFLQHHQDEDIWVIGGEQIYREFFKISDRLYITQVYGFFDGNAFCPPFKDKFTIVDLNFIQDEFEIQRWEKNK